MLIIAGVTIRSLVTAQAERIGYGQSDCPSIVQNAIDTVGTACIRAGRNKLCYGNSTIQAEFQPGAANPIFHAPGDLVDVAQIKQFTLGGMDISTKVWGMAEMKIQADLPNADPNQNVTLILFGSVQLMDGANDANAAVLTQTPGAIPRQNQYATATTRAISQQATHEGATATKIVGLESTATAYALTPTPAGTIPALKATQAAATATKLAALENTGTALPILQTPVPGLVVGGPYKGLQAFYFQSSDTAPCDQAPHDGILIQSPQGQQRVTLSIDGATVSLGSTVYVTAQPSKFLTIYTLEGSALITAVGQTQVATVGSAVQVPLDANLRASGAPVASQPYTADAIRALPIILLPNAITPSPGLSAGTTSTTWTLNTFVHPSECGLGKSSSFPVTVIADNGNSHLWITANWFDWSDTFTFAFVKSANGTYQATITLLFVNHRAVSETYNASLQFVDATHMTGEIADQCPNRTIPFSLTAINAVSGTSSVSPSPTDKP